MKPGIGKWQAWPRFFVSISTLLTILIVGITAASTSAGPYPGPPTPGHSDVTLQPGAASVGTAIATTTPTNTPTLIPCGMTTIFQEDFEDGTLGQFASSVPTCVPGGCGWVLTGTAHSGLFSAFAPAVGNISDQRLTTISPIPIPTGYSQVYLDFWQIYDLEPALDGGVLEFSTDGGASFTGVLSTTNFLQGGYNITLLYPQLRPHKPLPRYVVYIQ